MLESLVGGEYHRCLFCQVHLPAGDSYINHVKEHFAEVRNLNGVQNLAQSPPLETKSTQRKVRRFRKKRRKVSRAEVKRDPATATMSDDCLGDSELSDSSSDDSSGEHKREKLETNRREMRTLLARTRLSLAEEQLDRGDCGRDGKDGELVCLTCLKKFSNIQNLRRHLRLHISRDSNIPDEDSGTESASKEFKFSCDFCPEKFVNKAAYLVHEKTHGDKQPECYICLKTYADRYSLRYHLRTHGIGHQIRCELCNKSFPKPSRLQAHINAFHKNIRKFNCDKCDKTFKTRIHLENHNLLHTGERPHKCEECGEHFRHKMSLVAHQRIHGDVRPYVCETCGKSFREPSTLKAHMRVHSGDKPYKCDLCDKSFTQRAGLNYHRRVHAGIKPFSCSKCDYVTAKMASLRSHEKAIHKLEPRQEAENDIQLSSSLPQQSTISMSVSPSLASSTALPLPSPPLQDGDALLADSSTSASIYSTAPHHSLPSFNILKSYESPTAVSAGTAAQGPIMADSIKSNNKDDCSVMDDRQSPYSQPSLSPPLTPPGGDYNYYGRGNNQHYPAFALNYSFNQRECGGSGYVDSEEYFQRTTGGGGKFGEGGGGGYCQLPRELKKGYHHQDYENYYEYSYYQPRTIQHTTFHSYQ